MAGLLGEVIGAKNWVDCNNNDDDDQAQQQTHAVQRIGARELLKRDA